MYFHETGIFFTVNAVCHALVEFWSQLRFRLLRVRNYKHDVGGILRRGSRQNVSGFAFGGSSLLIVVGVILETQREIEAQLTMRHYKGFLE